MDPKDAKFGTVVQVIGPVVDVKFEGVFFSTNTGEAWVFDPEDSLARCLCTNGQSLPSGITEAIDNFSIAWEGPYHFEKESMIFTENDGNEKIFLGYPIKKIQRAIEKGYNNWTYIRTSPTYDNIRNEPCFREIVKKHV